MFAAGAFFNVNILTNHDKSNLSVFCVFTVGACFKIHILKHHQQSYIPVVVVLIAAARGFFWIDIIEHYHNAYFSFLAFF